jgi:hypothetical protein
MSLVAFVPRKQRYNGSPVAKKVHRRSAKPRQRSGRRQRRFAWALRFEPGDAELRGLSAKARSGLEYATQLAEAARERRLSALEGFANWPLTIEDLAQQEDRPLPHIQGEIKQARLELFGANLSDSAIDYRLRKRGERHGRMCAEPDCRRPISALANGRQRFCDFHGSPAARVRRHRLIRAQGGGPSRVESVE